MSPDQPTPEQPHQPSADTSWMQTTAPQPPTKRSGIKVAVIASVLGTLAVVGLVAASVAAYNRSGPFAPAAPTTPPGPTIEDAKRECRTAFSSEFQRRSAKATDTGTGSNIVASVTDIRLEESRKTTDSTDEVNGTVYYDLTTPLIPPVHNILSLTCQATISGTGLTTEVRNR
jgi:hypothetical protein